MRFLDPADSVVAELEAFIGAAGQRAPCHVGQVLCVATESPDQPLSGLSDMLGRLGVALTPILVQPTVVGQPLGDKS